MVIGEELRGYKTTACLMSELLLGGTEGFNLIMSLLWIMTGVL